MQIWKINFIFYFLTPKNYFRSEDFSNLQPKKIVILPKRKCQKPQTISTMAHSRLFCFNIFNINPENTRCKNVILINTEKVSCLVIKMQTALLTNNIRFCIPEVTILMQVHSQTLIYTRPFPCQTNCRTLCPSIVNLSLLPNNIIYFTISWMITISSNFRFISKRIFCVVRAFFVKTAHKVVFEHAKSLFFAFSKLRMGKEYQIKQRFRLYTPDHFLYFINELVSHRLKNDRTKLQWDKNQTSAKYCSVLNFRTFFFSLVNGLV